VAERPSLSNDVAWRRVGDDAVLVHLKTNRIYSLNRTAARFLELIGEGCDRDAAEAALLSEFDVGGNELRREMDDLLEALAKDGLLL
jgi:coenzyme PQQ synthesis protein D (PqqD)